MSDDTIHEPYCGMCPMSDLFPKKWLHQIIMELAYNKKLRYGELHKKLHGINSKTLTERLRLLEEYKIVNREVFPEVPLRVEYELTEIGLGLYQALKQVCDWAIKWYPPLNKE